MKTKLTIILALIANMMSAQVLDRHNEILDTVCQSKLTAVYLYTIHTSDADDNAVRQLNQQINEELEQKFNGDELGLLRSRQLTISNQKGMADLLAGPTASGKSAIAAALAREMGAWILSADSMLVYKGMDIGTAKPPREEIEEFHMGGVDVVTPAEEFSSGAWLRAAAEWTARSTERQERRFFMNAKS